MPGGRKRGRGEGERVIHVAVVGQPNVGKSTLFNVLTGRNVHVANWPGVTVEMHEGYTRHRGYTLHFVDLPGIYGFSASTLEELIARNYILSGGADVVLVLVDSLAPERTMYLALQTLEITPRVVIAFTKSDIAHSYGIHIHHDHIARKLGVPVIPVSAVKETGIRELLDAIIDVAEGRAGRTEPLRIDYRELEPYVREAEKLVARTRLAEKLPARWIAVRLLEGDHNLEKLLREEGAEDVLKAIQSMRIDIENIFRSRPEELFSRKRFQYLYSIVSPAVVRVEARAPAATERLDRLFSHPLLGPAASLLLLLLMFAAIFTINTGFPLNIVLHELGAPAAAEWVEEHSLGAYLEQGLDAVSKAIDATWPDGLLKDLVLGGVVPGVGAVLVFLPLITLVALLLAVLEDTGLAPRIALSLHTLLSRIGVSGHAVFPITLSLGCNVPAVMATRATPSLRERIRLAMTLPFIPCQARLVVILAVASAISGVGGLLMVLVAYLVAFAVFAAVNKILYMLEEEREEPEMLLELPPLHPPSLKVVWWITWDSVKHFLVKAGTIIFLLSIAIWFMTSYTPGLTEAEDPRDSIGAVVARLFAPLLAPIGLSGDAAWITAFALVIGFVAKEAVLEALAITTGETTATDAIRAMGLTVPQIVALTLFTTLYVPCMATIAVIYQETRSLRITLLTIGIMMAVAYLVMVASYYLLLLL